MKNAKVTFRINYSKFSRFSTLNRSLKIEKQIESPLILLMHYNTAVNNVVGLSPMKNFALQMKKNGVKNFKILPILTNSQTNLKNRINQVYNHFNELIDQNYKNVNIFCYSMANLPLNGYINEFYQNKSNHESSSLIKSITYLSCPNK